MGDYDCEWVFRFRDNEFIDNSIFGFVIDIVWMVNVRHQLWSSGVECCFFWSIDGIRDVK